MIKAEQYKQNIPMELRQYKQWLWFKRIRKIDLKGKEKILKLPVSPITFKSDDWNNKEQWADFETAVNNIEGSKGLRAWCLWSRRRRRDRAGAHNR